MGNPWHEEKTTIGGWVVIAAWEMGKKGPLPSQGPLRLVIELDPDAAPRVRRRGINSGVMRRVQDALPRLRSAFVEPPLWKQENKLESANSRVVELLEELPPSPRSATGDYYGTLLQAYEIIAEESVTPTADLHTLKVDAGMSITKSALTKQLQRARQAREAEEAD